MKLVQQSNLMQTAALVSAFLFSAGMPAMAQYDAPPPSYDGQGPGYDAPPPRYAPGQLDSLVSRIALYPDPLLAQVLAAASFPDQIADGARWAEQYRNLRGDQLADAMYQANLPFDPAVQAIIPFPSVLQMMASDLNWTSELGNAVLADRPGVMDAVQRMRRAAAQYGYLRSNDQTRVYNTGSAVEIVPTDPSLIYVPVYDPYVVYAPPRFGFYIGSAIGYGPCYSIGAFRGWGWGGGFNWYNHAVIVNSSVWGRSWYNRGAYVHNYGNWDRGNWRNTYVNNRTVIVNNNGGYRGSNGYSSGGRNAYGSGQPAYNNRQYNTGQYDRNQNGRGGYSNNSAYQSGRSGSAPVAPNAGSYQGGRSYSGYRGAQAPVTPSAGSYQGGRSYSGYRGAQAPVTPSAGSYQGGRSYGGSNNGASGYRGGQAPVAAPVAPSAGSYQGGRSYGGFSGSRGVQSSPAPSAPSYQGGGRSSGGFSGGSGNRGAQQSSPAPSRSFEGGGNRGASAAPAARSERGGGRGR